jgi:hypothetical protein
MAEPVRGKHEEHEHHHERSPLTTTTKETQCLSKKTW